jgi:hypothetical protein
MRTILVALALLCSTLAHAQQETAIKVLGVYVDGLALNADVMAVQLQNITTAWVQSGLPAASLTTIELLNAGRAVPVSYPNMPTQMLPMMLEAHTKRPLQELRTRWEADVIILFRNAAPDACGYGQRYWVDGDFNPLADGVNDGLDLRFRDQWYIAIVSTEQCDSTTAAHEFGHLLGGGHIVTHNRLYPDARAHLVRTDQFCTNPNDPNDCTPLYVTTALGSPDDFGAGASASAVLQYSRPGGQFGNAEHNNVRTLVTTARSVANYFGYPANGGIVLRPPINLVGVHYGCVGGATRNDLYWQNDPASNVVVDRYEVWYSQPITTVYKYGWTAYVPYETTLVAGATARARLKACSGAACSLISSAYYDAVPLTCTGGGGGVKEW